MFRMSKFVYNLNTSLKSWLQIQRNLRNTLKSNKNELIKKKYKYFYSNLPKYVTIDVLVEEQNLILQLPYMLTRIIEIPNLDTKKNQRLLPEKFDSKLTTIKKNTEQTFDKLVQSIIRKNKTHHGLLLLISGTPKHLITSEDAMYALRTIIRLEREQMSRDKSVRKHYIDATHLIGFNRLIDCLIEIGEPHAKLEALKLLTIDFQNVQSHLFRDKLLNSIIVDIFDGVFNLRLTFETITMLSRYSSIQTFREKLPFLWVGLQMNEQFIDRSNILSLIDCIEYLPHSRAYVIALVEKHIQDYLKTFQVRHVIQMLYVMRNYRVHSQKLRAIAGKWCYRNVFTLNSNSFQDILKYFIEFKIYDEKIVKSIERYLKARSQNINDASIFTQISKYIMLFRIRDPIILNQLSEVLIKRIHYFPPYVVKDLIAPFGYLAYHPNTVTIFWETLEEYVVKHFNRIRPEDLMEILMNFIYLENYTLKFQSKIFNPNYLQRFLQTSIDGIVKARNMLYVYDMALTLENKNYNGPLLSKSAVRKSSFTFDTEVIHFIVKMEQVFNLVFRKHNMNYSRLIRLNWLPNNEIYIFDIVAYPKNLIQKKSLISKAMKINPEQFLIVLIEKSTHLTRDNILIGPQQMRIRHLQCLGHPVATINYSNCMDLKRSHEEMLQYFEERIFKQQYLPFTKSF